MFGIKRENSYLGGTGAEVIYLLLKMKPMTWISHNQYSRDRKRDALSIVVFWEFYPASLVVFTHFYNRNHGEIFLKLSECVNFNTSQCDCLNDQIKTRTSTQCETHLAALDMINSR